MPPMASNNQAPSATAVAESTSSSRGPADLLKAKPSFPMLARANTQRQSLATVTGAIAPAAARPPTVEATAGPQRDLPTSSIPVRIPTVSTARHQHQLRGGGSAGPTMAGPCRGIPIQTTARGQNVDTNNTNNNNHHHHHTNRNMHDPFADCFAPRNTWPRNGGTRANITAGAAAAGARGARGGGRAGGYRYAAPAAPDRSPLSIYGDGAFHSFTVCGAPGCQVCTHDGFRQQAAFFLPVGDRDAAGAAAGAGVATSGGFDRNRLEKPGRSLVQLTCENCRMPFIPKVDPEEEQEASRPSTSSGATSACTTPEKDVYGVETSVEAQAAAGGQGDEDEEEVVKTSSALRGDYRWGRGGETTARTTKDECGGGEDGGRGQGFVHESRRCQSTGDGAEKLSPGFCSGECKMSYMLTNPAARRRQRAAAAANAAARAAFVESQIQKQKQKQQQQQQQLLNSRKESTQAQQRPVRVVMACERDEDEDKATVARD